MLYVLSEEQLAEIARSAKRSRAEYVASLLSAALARVVAFGSGIREIAVACTAARLSRS